MVESTAKSVDMQDVVLKLLSTQNEIADSESLLSSSVTAQQLDAALKSLQVEDYITLDVISKQKLELTGEGAGYATNGTPEFQYASALEFNVVTSKADVEAKVGA